MENIEEDFRDHIATVDKKGKRIWIYPKKPSGKFYNYRKYVSYVLLLILVGLPFIKWNGEPLFLINILESKFILFGFHFAIQDFHLFVIAMLIGMIFIALFTVIFGRLFCGWVCPQTIFMEMVFRRIEYWIEGDFRAQKKLNDQALNAEKIKKKTAKHALFIFVSILVAHTFLSYILGIEALQKLVTEPISEHWSGFIAMVFFTIVFYGVFSIMREQVCTTICPYGRMQSVLLDENSLTVAYDFVRGEPRGKLSKQREKSKSSCKSDCDACKSKTVESICAADKLKEMFDTIEPERKGDCVDCNLCVQVCPTGIDIRNGTQLECVNCTACMDACDEVMVKIKKPEGLIRIDSYNGIVAGKRKILNGRVYAYSLVLVLLMGLEAFMFYARTEVETLFLRTPGLLYQAEEDGYISNLYNYQLINKTNKDMELNFHVEGRPDILFVPVGKISTATKNSVSEGAMFIKIPREKLSKRKNNITIIVSENERIIDKTKTSFLGPTKK